MVAHIYPQCPYPTGVGGADPVRVPRFNGTDAEERWRDRLFLDRDHGHRHRRERTRTQHHIGEQHNQRCQDRNQQQGSPVTGEGELHVFPPIPLR